MVRAIRVRGVREERGVPIKGRTGKGAVRVRGLPPAITLTAPAPAAPPYPYSPALEITYGRLAAKGGKKTEKRQRKKVLYAHAAKSTECGKVTGNGSRI
jgi:hypothetical protein